MAKIKLAQPGIDAATAGDENLIFSSDWPLLKIFKQGQFTANQAGDNYIVTEHKLGYPPVFLYFGNNLIQNWMSVATGGDKVIVERSEFAGGLQRIPTVDNQAMRFNATGSFAPPQSFFYYIYALSLEAAYKAPRVNVGKQPRGQAPRSVFKVAKAGKSVKSASLEDYAIHSGTRSPLIHSVNPLTTVAGDYPTGFGATATHDLGYVPLYFTYQKIDASIGAANGAGQWIATAPLFIDGTVDTTKITINAESVGIEVCVVVLKDPFEVDYSVVVNV